MSAITFPLPEQRSGAHTKAQQVADKIWEMICAGNHREGDSLPTEHELSARFDVSLPVVREAVGRLRGLGVVESRPRVGLRVANAGPFDAFRFLLPKLAGSEEGYRDVCRLRVAIEVGSAVLLAETITPAHVAALNLIVAQSREAKDMAEFRELDAQFHQTLLRFSRSSLLQVLGDLIRAYLLTTKIDVRLKELDPSSELRTAVERTIAGHQEIVDALVRHDVEKVARAMRAHIDFCPHFERFARAEAEARSLACMYSPAGPGGR